MLSCSRGGNVFAVTADSFSAVDFNGVEVLSGDKYYADKAVASGATQEPPKATRKKAIKK